MTAPDFALIARDMFVEACGELSHVEVEAALRKARDEALEEAAAWHDYVMVQSEKTADRYRKKSMLVVAESFDARAHVHRGSAFVMRSLKGGA